MNPDAIREFAAAFQKSRILLTGIELGIFTAIEETGSGNDKIAGKLNLNPNACERLLNALTALDFISKRNGIFFNTDDSYKFLSKKSPDYLGGLMHTNHLWNTWSQLTNVVKTGKSAHSADINDRGDKWLHSFITAMHDRAKKQAPRQLANLSMGGIKSVLDVGGGSGAFMMQLIRQKEGLQATVFDLPNVIPITQEFIDKEGFTGKIKTCTGDYTVDELPQGYDLVFLSAIIHSNSLETNSALIKKCFAALNSSGKIIIQDWIMNSDRTQPVSGAVFAINMLVGTEAGDCFTEDEVNEMLNTAGFRNITKTDLEAGLSQIVAQKP